MAYRKKKDDILDQIVASGVPVTTVARRLKISRELLYHRVRTGTLTAENKQELRSVLSELGLKMRDLAREV